MSKCISREGEYSDHVPDPEDFYCTRCGVLDEDALLAEVRTLRTFRDSASTLVWSPEAVRWRDEAARGTAQMPYASNRYLRLVDDLRAAVRIANSPGFTQADP